MNCQAVQNKILALPDPRSVPDPLRVHVLECPGCRAWAEQAARLEGLLELLPVPPALGDKKLALIADLTHGRTEVAPAAAQPETFRGWLRKNAALVGGLAAAVLVVTGAWIFSGGGNPPVVAAQEPPRDPFLDKLVKQNVTVLAKADTPAKKLQALGDLADNLASEARGLARIASPDDLRDVARWFDKVVKDGVVRQADKIAPAAMTPAERKALLESLARKLEATAAEVEKVAGECPPESKQHLQRIAEAARDGQKKLAQ